MTFNFKHGTLGPVRLRVSRTARQFVATWKPGFLQLTVPAGVTSADIDRALEDMAPRLLKVRPAKRAWFADGVVIDCGDLKIYYRKNPDLKRCCVYRFETVSPTYYEAVVQFSTDTDWTTPSNLKGLTNMALDIMRRAAAQLLPPMVEGVFQRLGVRPRAWSVSRGQRILGTCRRSGEIRISCAVMMLPPHLREFIVCHEAAHLTHHDHSPAFHDLLNRYTAGREKALNAELRAFKWPLPRM